VGVAGENGTPVGASYIPPYAPLNFFGDSRPTYAPLTFGKIPASSYLLGTPTPYPPPIFWEESCKQISFLLPPPLNFWGPELFYFFGGFPRFFGGLTRESAMAAPSVPSESRS
jgi:hypothetical protein